MLEEEIVKHRWLHVLGKKIVANNECEAEFYGRCKLMLPVAFQAPRRYMAEILKTQHKTLSKQSIQKPKYLYICYN